MFGVLGLIGDDVRTSPGSCRALHDDSDKPAFKRKRTSKTYKNTLRSSGPHPNLIPLSETGKKFFNLRECARNRPAKHVVSSFLFWNATLSISRSSTSFYDNL